MIYNANEEAETMILSFVMFLSHSIANINSTMILNNNDKIEKSNKVAVGSIDLVLIVNMLLIYNKLHKKENYSVYKEILIYMHLSLIYTIIAFIVSILN